MPERRALLGLIGAPIAHSAAPAMHEAAGAATGVRVHYQLIEVPGADTAMLRILLEAVRRMGFAGVNVTFPYKEAVLPLLDAIAPEAAPIGAVNTVVVKDGQLIGYNTDTTGFAAAIAEDIPDPAAGPVVLVGAGGVGRAAGFALARIGVKDLRILDQDPARAARLAAETGATAPADLATALSGAAGVVNATPVGMLPDRGTPIPAALLRPDLWVADVVYYPLMTPLLTAAKATGARILTGRALTIRQAADAFALFTDTRPPIEALGTAFDAVIAGRGVGRA